MKKKYKIKMEVEAKIKMKYKKKIKNEKQNKQKTTCERAKMRVSTASTYIIKVPPSGLTEEREGGEENPNL